MADADHVQEILIIDREDLTQARRVAAANGVDVEEIDVRGIEPVSTVTLLLFGATAAVATVVYLLENAKGGQVIDLRPGASATFYRSKDLVYGLVVVLATDGKVTVEVKEPRGMFGPVVDTLKDIVADHGKAGIEQVGREAKRAVGGAADVNVEP